MGFWTWLTGNEQETVEPPEEKKPEATGDTKPSEPKAASEEETHEKKGKEAKKNNETVRIDGRKLRDAIKEKGFTGREVAAKIGRSPDYVNHSCKENVISKTALDEILRYIDGSKRDYVVGANTHMKRVQRKRDVMIAGGNLQEVLEKKRLKKQTVSKAMGRCPTFLADCINAGSISKEDLEALCRVTGIQQEEFVVSDPQRKDYKRLVVEDNRAIDEATSLKERIRKAEKAREEELELKNLCESVRDACKSLGKIDIYMGFLDNHLLNLTKLAIRLEGLLLTDRVVNGLPAPEPVWHDEDHWDKEFRDLELDAWMETREIPTREEVRAFVEEKEYKDINADKVFDQYEKNGWVGINGHPIMSWKQAITCRHNQNVQKEKKMKPKNEEEVTGYFVSCGMQQNVAATEAKKFIKYYDDRGWLPPKYPNNPWLPKDGWKTYASKWAKNHFEWKGETA